MTGWSFLIVLVVRADVTKVHFEGGVVQFKIGQRAVIDGVPSYGYENIGAKLRRNALMALADLAFMSCVSKVIELGVHLSGNLDGHLSNKTILLCLYDFEGVGRRKEVDVLQSDIKINDAQVKVVRICVDPRLDFRDLSTQPLVQFVLKVLSIARIYCAKQGRN